MKSLIPVLILCAVAAKANDATARVPVLVELFTSEGCSSCPPADAFLQKLDSAQPISGAELIVLSEHVDYWNHDGWKDPYSSSSITERQSAYVHVLGQSEPYTPEMIADGSDVLKLTDPQQMNQVFLKDLGMPALAVRIEGVKLDGPALRAHIATGEYAGKRKADVYMAVALSHVESQVSAGENHGKHLSHTAVVEYLKKIGSIEEGKSFNQDVQLKLKNGVDPQNVRVVAFVQEAGPGRVVGAGLQKAPFE